ncbi:MAG: 3-deoxy-manno-octulosonate cytidylyltransferase [Thermogutta sp.]|nr:3-deoxy-manno-octulosonate cytidylyltransferase [Thermogutta sp.]HOP78553.1 3-deoxy-manno-octulosonate cytidylyltransferase [Thermogutta sp.]HPU07398.1 3-deoxy-manno-octulosonate cytidylyltransferase [Thermogutta sp.]HQF14681.1 3-deoxy-manno-octulosonate cytidylyltransferase [Thermogutta sp.]
MKSWIVIPARLASTRLPRKMLLSETGKPLIQHTYEAASQARRPAGICVACDDEEIARVVRSFGGDARLTSPHAQSGTDRVAEIARSMPDVEIFVNVQGDEPEISGEAVDLAVELLERHPQASVSTVAAPLRNREALHDPACVKVVCDKDGYALYFSRSVIPYPREWSEEYLTASPPCFLQHMGLYAYRRSFLLSVSNLEVPYLERLEKLEQLRFLYHGAKIVVGLVDSPTCGIDTPEDYRRFVERYRARYTR